MSASVCARLGDLLVRRDEDRLAPFEERLLLEHLAGCPGCASEALRHDPVLLFARDASLGAPAFPDGESRERFVSDVLAATATAKAGRRFGARVHGAGLRIAASLLLAASLVGVWFARGHGGESARVAPAPAAIAAEARPVAADALPAVEELGGDGAFVYEFPATSPGEPTVVFVVDRNADI